MKNMILLVAGILAMVAIFTFVTRQQSAAEAQQKRVDYFIGHCAANLNAPDMGSVIKKRICNCMRGEFQARGVALEDALASDVAGAAEIRQECVAAVG